jgi:hypothetical protein
MSEPSVRVSEPKVSRMVGQNSASSNRIVALLRHLNELRDAFVR